jgi:preprotein translocase subunit SecF
LLIGVGIGTYSSVFMAAPIVLDFDKVKKKPSIDVKEPKKVPA